METHFRVRQASEVLSVFKLAEDTDFDDNETESDDDHVKTESIYESEEDNFKMEIDGNDGEISIQQAEAPQQSKKRRRKSYLCSKNNFIWLRNAPEPRGKRSLPKYVPSPKGQALNATTPLEAWSVLFTNEILNIIMIHTNEEIARTVAKISETGGRVSPYHKSVDLVELRAMIGLLYFAGLHKVNHTNVRNLWSPYNMSLFRSTMSENRFMFLLLSVRFDDKNTRAKRKADDRLANIREIWDMFVANCMANYEPHAHCIIDEQLLPFRGRCLFRVYMPAKPDKCGLKIVTLNDAMTHYMYNAIPYVGIVDKDSIETVPSYYIRKLSEPIYHSGRNITCDDWFTSIPICDKMKKDYNLTMVGTIRKNKREIPEEFKKMPPAGMNVQFCYHDKKTLVSYNSKGKETVLFLSSLHVNGKIDSATDEPEIVVFYNNMKGGTDSFDKKCRDYTTARKTRRWLMRYFYGMLDQANVNSLILYTLCENNVKMKPTDFILDLSLALIKPFLSRRLTITTLRSDLRVQIESFLKYYEIPEDQDPRDLISDNKMERQKRCAFCSYTLDRKTFYMCLQCKRPMCRQHVAKICCNCAIQTDE
ncbi:piggyBac transposable element-derived protein 4-like [Temnothorax nylanderi]|uniref:piggyBac transposable element-derived protein 4-like n=1 Tax=Temnothorax nylanderi TaxID=102681 RepID=UPI003A8961BF